MALHTFIVCMQIHMYHMGTVLRYILAQLRALSPRDKAKRPGFATHAARASGGLADVDCTVLELAFLETDEQLIRGLGSFERQSFGSFQGLSGLEDLSG